MNPVTINIIRTVLTILGLIFAYEGTKILLKESFQEIKDFTKSVKLKLRRNK